MPSKGKKEQVEVTTRTEHFKRTSWMSPLNKIIFHKAFVARQKEVQIGDGRQFNIDYSKRPGFAWVSPIGADYIPAGWFDMSRVTKKDWCASD
jgi:hypothetical protein